MGAGSSLEAAYSLRAPIPAGTWLLVADGIITEPVDVHFELLWRHGDGAADTRLAAFDQHFDPLPDGSYRAQPYEVSASVGAVAAVTGDQLVFRYSGESASLDMSAYVPNGDGETTGGRIPYIDLPP